MAIWIWNQKRNESYQPAVISLYNNKHTMWNGEIYLMVQIVKFILSVIQLVYVLYYQWHFMYKIFNILNQDSQVRANNFIQLLN